MKFFLTTFHNSSDITIQETRKIPVSLWKNKKGRAPPRPMPQRRPVKEMPLEDLNIELSDIEVKQIELERQGTYLENMIREKTETGNFFYGFCIVLTSLKYRFVRSIIIIF